jgi:cell division protein FtsB
MNRKHRIFKNIPFVLFAIGAAVVATLEAIDGNWIATFWAFIAVLFDFLLELDNHCLEDYRDLTGDLLEVVRKQDKEIAALKAENEKLKEDKR